MESPNSRRMVLGHTYMQHPSIKDTVANNPTSQSIDKSKMPWKFYYFLIHSVIPAFL